MKSLWRTDTQEQRDFVEFVELISHRVNRSRPSWAGGPCACSTGCRFCAEEVAANQCVCGHVEGMHPFGLSENIACSGKCMLCSCREFRAES